MERYGRRRRQARQSREERASPTRANSHPGRRRVSLRAEQDDLLRVLQAPQNLRDRRSVLRVGDVRGELGERQQDEAALVHLGVRDLQRAFGDGLIVEQQDIEIYDARAPALALDALASHRRLDGLGALQEIVGLELGLELEDTVDEPRLRVAVRLAFVERRRFDDARRGEGGELLLRLAKVGLAIAEIRAESDVDAM